MELTLEAARQTTFSERRRGYDTEEVDGFRKAVIDTIEALQARLRGAEAQAGEGDDQLLRRSLELAQRASETWLAEASDKAARLVADAQRQADEILEEARKSARVEQLRGDVTALEEARSALEADVDALASFADDERNRLRSVLGELDRQLESRLRSRAHERPPTHSLAAPLQIGTVRGVVSGAGGHTVGAPPLPTGRARTPSRRKEVGSIVPATEDLSAQPADDAFFAELRLAMSDDEPLGTLESAMVDGPAAEEGEDPPGNPEEGKPASPSRSSPQSSGVDVAIPTGSIVSEGEPDQPGNSPWRDGTHAFYDQDGSDATKAAWRSRRRRAEG